MFVPNFVRAMAIAAATGFLSSSVARADEIVATPIPLQLQESTASLPAAAELSAPGQAATLLGQTSTSVETTLNDALDLIGIRYRRGGSSPESGFDCSGFVSHVFREGLGLYLPHSAREMSKAGNPVEREDLKPGDLVFFATVRKTISHVGIYLGDNLFVHAPHRGAKIRIDDLGARYWFRHFKAARRVADE
jgi:cell wall-associated NlpC family hydrolase